MHLVRARGYIFPLPSHHSSEVSQIYVQMHRSPSYVSRISVGKCSRIFSLHGTWFKTTTSRKRPRCKFACKTRENLNWDNLFFTRLCYIIKMNTDSLTDLREGQSLNTIWRDTLFCEISRTVIWRGVCSHCCVNPSLSKINLRPDGDSQSYRFVWQLSERREKHIKTVIAKYRILLWCNFESSSCITKFTLMNLKWIWSSIDFNMRKIKYFLCQKPPIIFKIIRPFKKNNLY